LRDQKNASVNPLMMCQTPHQAAIIVMPPNSISGGKILGLNMSARANPEFCIPVSMAMVRRSACGSLFTLLKKYPVAKAAKQK